MSISIIPGEQLVSSLTDLGGKIIDKIWPNKVEQEAERTKAQLALLQMQQEGELKLIGQQMSAVLAEAQSSDPWTSRARPSFLYVIYIMILFGIPMGFVSAFKPDFASAVADGMKAWLTAIPDELYTLFGIGYLGYTGSRSLEKRWNKAK